MLVKYMTFADQPLGNSLDKDKLLFFSLYQTKNVYLFSRQVCGAYYTNYTSKLMIT